MCPPKTPAVMSRKFVYRVLGEGRLYKGQRWEWSGQSKGRRETGYRGDLGMILKAKLYV